MRQRALERARSSAYAPGEFVGQESFMTAGEIRALAVQAGIGPGVTVLDVCCGVAGPGRLLVQELGCVYLGVDASASAVAVARERARDLPCRFAIAQVPPLPAGSFEVVLLLETMLAFEDKDTLVREIAAALRPGGRFAFTLEEGAPLTAAERAAMPNSDTVWLTPLDEMIASLERAGLAVTWLQDHSRAHRATAHALAGAYTRRTGRWAVDDLVAAHRLWVEWLDEGRVRKLALVAEPTVDTASRTARGSTGSLRRECDVSDPPTSSGNVRLKITPQTDFYAAGDERAKQEAFELEGALKRALPKEVETRPAADEKGVITDLVIPLASSGAMTAMVEAFKAWLSKRPTNRSIDVEFEIDESEEGTRKGTFSVDAQNVDDKVLDTIARGVLESGT